MSTLAIQLREILIYVNGYCLIPVFIFGIVGNLTNIVVFCQGTLKNNACSLYFVSISIVHLFVLCFGSLTRIVITLSGFDLTRYSIVFCKLRVYFFIGGIAISRFYLCLISIDRWFVTSLNARTRRRSNLKTTRRIILISTILWLVFTLHVAIGFRQEISGCIPSSEGFYFTFYLSTNLLLAIIPFFVVILLTVLTLQRVLKNGLTRKRRQVVYPMEIVQGNIIPSVIRVVANEQDERLSTKNVQLIRLNVIQVIFFILFNLPNTLYTLYSFITKTFQKSNDQITIDNFFNYLGSYLLYTHCAISFYIYTLASITFRREFWSICHRIQQHIVAYMHRL